MRVVRGDGDVVRRRTGPWTPAVHDLLNYLEQIGFPYSPRVLGLDDEGCELLTFIPGDSGTQGWSRVVPEAGLAAFARMLRTYHDAVADYRPTTTEWATVPRQIQAGELICHGDFGPWNVVWQDATPVGILDWDLAGPRPASYDLAYALEYVAPFRADEECVRWLGHPEPPDRQRRIELFAESYGLTSVAGLVDRVVEVQRESAIAVNHLAQLGMQPQVEWVANGFLDELAQRVAWTQAHRDLMEGAER